MTTAAGQPPGFDPRPRAALLPWALALMIFAAGAMVAGLLAAGGVLRQVRIRDEDHGARVTIRSPWGELSLRAGARAGSMGMAIFPGAELVPRNRPSAFREPGPESGASGLTATLAVAAGGHRLRLAAAEFAVAAPPSEVIAFYRRALASHGKIEQSADGQGGVRLAVKLADAQGWAVAVRPWRGGSRFLLLRARAGGAD